MPVLSRRRLIGTSIAAAAAATTAPRITVGQDGERIFHGFWPYASPPQSHYNDFVTDAIVKTPNIYGDLVYQPFALYTWATREWLPLMATSWAFINPGGVGATPAAIASPAASPVADADPLVGIGVVEPGSTVFQVKLREGTIWSDDQPFTSADVVATFTLQRLMSNVVWKYLESVEAVDDHTVNFHMSQPSTVVQRYVLRTSTQSRGVYGEWADRAAGIVHGGKTNEDPEWLQLLDEFNQFRPDRVVASGPMIIDMATMSESTFEFVLNPKAWNAEGFPFDKILDYNGSGDVVVSSTINGDFDYSTGAYAPAVEEEILAQGFRIVRPPIYSGPAIIFNYGKHPSFADPRVRQAIACAINRDDNGFFSLAESGVASIYMGGCSDNHLDDWLSADELAGLDPYAYDLDRATQLLTDAGWTKDGDTWLQPDGSQASFEFSWPAEFPDWSAAAQHAVDSLTTFGFQLEARAITSTQHPIDVDKGNFDLAVRGWGSSSNPHPHFSYTTAFFVHNTLAINNGGEGMQFPLEQEVPGVGTVNLEQLTLDSADGLDEEAQKEKVATIARVYNAILPAVPLWERYGNNPIVEGVRVNPWPPDEHPIYQNSPYADGIVTMFMLTNQISSTAD